MSLLRPEKHEPTVEEANDNDIKDTLTHPVGCQCFWCLATFGQVDDDDFQLF